MPQLTAESPPPDVEPAFDDDLQALRHKYADLWRSTPPTPPPSGDVDRRRQRATEHATDRFVDETEDELRACPAGRAARAAMRARLQERLRDFARDGLELPAAHRDVVFSDAWFDGTAEFARRARAFDDGLELLDLFQALRNVWIMNLFQALLDQPVRLTSAMLGYSLLYPYTDNRLDAPDLPAARKRSFCDRLERRLRGELLPALDDHERAVFELVAMIEEQYRRDAYPELYLSLLAIHHAQERSLRLQSAVDGEDVLGLSVAKGGASVLADGYLVAGDLEPGEADFCFGYGVVLQLMDDLQDVEQDLDARHVTLFTRGTRRGLLDDLASRLHNFLGAVLDGSPRFADPRFDTLKDLIRSHCSQLIVQSAAQHPRHFSPRFLERLEGHSPVRFVYARWKRKELQRRFRKLDATLKRSGRLGSLFEALADDGGLTAKPPGEILPPAPLSRAPSFLKGGGAQSLRSGSPL